ncbi:MAG: phospho-N-acetylmuramoyl-pentapeptide-transferase [Lachnospiraceae bacterium]|nr:phospho-N-acetylmuramoyl-pentapeptide-transferase [Lachnospiraceae bacterium]
MKALFALITAFVLSACFTHLLIPFLRKLKFGQQEREDGPKEHLKKAGTPTMGGLAFVPAAAIAGAIFSWPDFDNLIVIIIMLGFGLVGFLDDYLKVVKKNTKGLSPKLKMLGQFVVATALLVYMYMGEGLGTDIIIPFAGGYKIDLSYVYIPFFYIVVMGTDNGVNFTDGVDGLCSSVTAVVCAFFALASVKLGLGMEATSCALIGALLGYLLFNLHPAQVFMGDTGSLSLGGYVAAMALIMKMPLFIIIVGFVYLAEMLSVMIQVAYFKKTGGKRIFRMAPIHHHFELGGWSETQVVGRFTVLTIILCVIGYIAL